MSRAAERLRVMIHHLDQSPSAITAAPTSAQTSTASHPQRLRYTVESSLLTPEQRISYEKNGFILIKNLVSEEDINRFRKEFERICRQEVKVPGLLVMRDLATLNSEFVPDQKAVSKLQDFQEDSELFHYCSLPQMCWTRFILLSLLTTFLILTFFSVVESAAVRDDQKADRPQGPARQVFMPGSDASNFFKRRSRRSPKHYAELQAEQRVRLSADERRREYNEEQRDEYENYVEENRDEQNERSRETSEQLREYHYDGLYPRYHWYH